MVFIEPGLAEQIGTGGIDKFIAGINHVINPDYNFQEAMKVQLATNPKLAQELSDLETNAPGTLKSLGFGPLTKVLTAIPESASGQVAREAKPEIVAGQKAEIQAKSAEAQFQGKSFADALAAIKGDDPASVQLRHELINRMVTGSISPEEDVALKQAQTREQQSRADILKAQEPGVIAKAQIENKQYQHLLDNYPAIAAMDPVQITRDLMNNKNPGDLVGFLTQGPAAQEALTQARIIFEAQAARDQRLLMWAQIHAAKDPEHAANIQAAKQMLIKTNTGTLAAWYTAITDPEKVEQIKTKANGGGALNQDEKDILKVDEAQRQQQNVIDEKEAAGLNAQLFRAKSAVESAIRNNASEADIALGMEGLNASLNARVPITGRKIVAVYGNKPDVGSSIPVEHSLFHPFSGPRGLYYIDENGNRVKDSEAFTPAKPNTVGGNLNADEARVLAVIKSKTDPAEKARYIEIIKKNSPAIYAKIQDLVK
jgi:hypothetical protein